MDQSNPKSSAELPLIQSAMILLLLHPLVSSPEAFILPTKIPLRTVLLQVIGRCVRRSQRSGCKTLTTTLPHLLPHFKAPSRLQLIVSGLQKDLQERFCKLKLAANLYTDAITNNLLSVFDLFYLINEAFAAIKYEGHIKPDQFYFKPLQTLVDIKEDFVHWRNLEEARRVSPSPSSDQTVFAFCDYPWILDLEVKGELLRSTGGLRMRHQLQDAFFRAIFDGVQSTNLLISVRRENLLADTLAQLEGRQSHELAKQLKVEFIGEEGVDEGGLRKEFFQLCWDGLFNGDYGIFEELAHNRGLFWFRPGGDLDECRLLGILLGLAVYNGILIELRFPNFLLKRLLNWPVFLEDYSEIDSQLVRSINLLNRLDSVNDLGLYFAAGELETELIPGGCEIAVNDENREEYFKLLQDFYLRRRCEFQFEAFKKGFETVCGESVLYAYRPEELFSLIHGFDIIQNRCEQFNLKALASIVTYEGGFSENSPTIRWFWEIIVDQFHPFLQVYFLQFVTGSSRAPVGGLARLESFVIMKVGDNDNRLPSAHTCFNTLLLPEYSCQRILSSKLTTAIMHCKEFGLR